MTAPVIENPNLGLILAQSFSAAYSEAQRLKLERQKLAQQQQELESQNELRAAQTDETRAATKQRQTEMERHAQDLRDQSEALALVQGNMQSVQDPQRFGDIFAGIKEPGVAAHVLTYRDQFLKQQNDATALQTAAEDRTATQAGGEAVRGLAGQAPTVAPQVASALQGIPAAAVPGVLAAGQHLFPPPPVIAPPTFGERTGRINAFGALIDKGMTVGQARAATGLPPIPGVDDKWTKAQIGGGAQLGQRAQLAGAQLTTMLAAAPIIDAMIAKTGGVTLRGEVLRTSRGGLIAAFVNKITDPDQQTLVQAIHQFADGWRRFVSGQQTSDPEFYVILNFVADRYGDTPQLAQQKSAMRQMMLQSVQQAAANGGLSAVSALSSIIQTARSNNWDPRLQSFLAKQFEDAKIWQRRQQAGTTVVPGANDPVAPIDWDNVNAQVDSLQ